MGGMVDSIFGGAPKAPDPTKTAAAQGNLNRQAVYDSAAVNQINQNGPGFNVNYTGEIGDPNRTVNYELTGNRAALANQLGSNSLDLAQNMSGSSPQARYTEAGPIAGPQVGGPNNFDYSDPSGRANQVEDTMYNALRSRLDKTQDRTFDRNVNMLTQRGLPDTGQAFGNEMADMYQEFGDQDIQAARTAMEVGQAEDSRLFDQDFNSAGFNMNADQQRFNQESGAAGFDVAKAQLAAMLNNQNFNQDMASSGFDMNKFITMMNANPENSVQMPNQPAYQIAPADLMGTTNNAYNAESNQYNSSMGGLSSLGGAGMMAYAMSSPKFKEDHREIGDILPRIDLLEVKAWKYKKGYSDGGNAGYHIGPYADQFKELFGIGDGVTINLMDAVGILLAGMKELSQRVRTIEEPCS